MLLSNKRKTDVLKKSTAWPQFADAGISGTTSKSPLIREKKGEGNEEKQLN